MVNPCTKFEDPTAIYMPKHCYFITYFLHYSLLEYESLCSLVDNSAKLTDENEITPESNYVFISENGTCVWEPRYELSVTQCPVDVTWFPFDRQVCDLAFESWLLNSTFLNLVPDDDAVDVSSFLPPDAWHLTGTFYWSTDNAGTGKEIPVTHARARVCDCTDMHTHVISAGSMKLKLTLT